MKKNDTHQFKNNSKTANIVVFTLMICIMFLTVGYSAFSATGSIEGVMASVRPSANVRITKLEITGTSDGGISSSQNFNKNKIYGTIDLPNANSTVTYKVDMTVFLGAEMKLMDITGLPSNLEYSISSYTFGDTICDSQNHCNYGATDDLYITIGYKSGGYNAGSTEYAYDLDFDFQVVDHVAKVGNTYYESLQAAFNAVPNNTQTQVQLLKNRSENVTVAAGKNIELQLNGYTLSNNGNANVIVVNGTLTMLNGTISSNQAQGAVNVNNTGTFTMNSGSIIVTKTSSKQAVYNDGGTVTINAGTLSTQSSIRACVQNTNGGTMTINGGTITATNFNGLDNSSTLTIGSKDGSANQSSPSITGSQYGVNSSTNFNYYDGVFQGRKFAISNESKVADTETGTSIIHKGTTISSKSYDAVHLLSSGAQVTFDTDGGTIENSTILYESGVALGFLPTPEKTGYVFDDWYSQPGGTGTKITTSTTVSSATTYYAKWIDMSTYAVAQIGQTKYLTLADAMAAVPNNTQTTIEILDNIELTTRISTTSGQKITFDLQGYTIENDTAYTDLPIFENTGGVIVIQNGTVRANGTTQGAINNKSTAGSMTINNLTVIATGTRQCVYTDKGTTYITGNSHLSNASVERAAVHNLGNGKTYITGGTIVSTNFSAIYNASGTVTFGSDDGSVSTSSPSAQGTPYGIDNASTFNYYDGVLKGTTHAINGNVTNHDANTSVTIGSEVIGNNTYETATLQ